MKLEKQEALKVEWLSFGGLDLQPDVLSRPFDSWRRAENIDLFVPGSIRKVVGPGLAVGPFPAVIVEMFSYRRAAGNAVTSYAIGANGHLYQISGLVDVATLGTVTQPAVILFPGTAAGGVAIQYAVITLSGAPPVKWEPTGGVSQVGVSPAATGVTLTPTFSATNANAYLMQVGIQYLWTYFNPDTLHESSPSPVPSTAIITPTVNQPPPATPYITQVQVAIPTPVPAVGTGYTRIRLYRTRDGGATFYLLPHAYNAGGVDQLDANGSALITGGTTTLFDGVAASNIAPASDLLMVNPPAGAPATGSHNPPPNAIWAAVYQSRAWYLDPDGLTLWFSEIGDFQSVGVFSFFRFARDIFDTITAIVPLSDRMIVHGKNTARQITGTDFSDFVEVPVDMRRGSAGRRTAISDGDNVYVLTQQSLARLAFKEAGPPFVGDKIKPLTDTITASSKLLIANMEIDTNRSQMLFAVQINGLVYNDQIIVTDLSRDSPFTVILGLPTEVVTIRELEADDGSKTIFFSGADQKVYNLYGSPGALTSTLETQQLPLTDINIWKVFKSADMFGSDLANWQISFSVDGRAFSQPQFIGIPIGSIKSLFGGAGRQIVLRFVHSVANGQAALLSRGTLWYEAKMGTL